MLSFYELEALLFCARADTMSIFAKPVLHKPKPEDTIKDLKSMSPATLILNSQMHALYKQDMRHFLY